ncbi:MAG: hypothetical protein ACOVLC_04065 [Flavobacterium sp.]
MNIKRQLIDLWESDYINNLPIFIKERGFVLSENFDQKDILITGINPSFRKDADNGYYSFDFQDTLKEEKYDNYWGPIKKMLIDKEETIDLRNKTAYLDIFYFREKNQIRLKKEILNNHLGIKFLVDQLTITQLTIENIIKPKLIIVKNKESSAYWGKNSSQGIFWMGYKLKLIENLIFGDLFKIIGLEETNQRINLDIKETKLLGCLVLFTEHITQYTKKDKRPTALILNQLLEKYE